jgi:hypothetical protein
MQKRGLQPRGILSPGAGSSAKKKRNPLGLRKLPPKEEDGGVFLGTKDSPKTAPFWGKEIAAASSFCAPHLLHRSASGQKGSTRSIMGNG